MQAGAPILSKTLLDQNPKRLERLLLPAKRVFDLLQRQTTYQQLVGSGDYLRYETDTQALYEPYCWSAAERCILGFFKQAPVGSHWRIDNHGFLGVLRQDHGPTEAFAWGFGAGQMPKGFEDYSNIPWSNIPGRWVLKNLTFHDKVYLADYLPSCLKDKICRFQCGNSETHLLIQHEMVLVIRYWPIPQEDEIVAHWSFKGRS